MDNIYTGSYSYRIYYGDGNTSGVVRANSESEACDKFRTLTDWGKSGKPIVKVVKIG